MAQRFAFGTVISHWNHLIEGMQYSPKNFYESVIRSASERQIPQIKFTTVSHREGGVLSAQRLYLRVSRHEYDFDICGAPFGKNFFVSWWLKERLGCLGALAEMSLAGLIFKHFVRPITYYRVDTALMFQQSVHSSVLEVMDSFTQTKGIRVLTESERKPVMREFFAR